MQNLPPPPPGFTLDTAPQLGTRPVFQEGPPQPSPRHPEQVVGDRLANDEKRRNLNKPDFIPQGATHMMGPDGRAVPIPGAQGDPKLAAEKQAAIAELDGFAKLLFKQRRDFNQDLKGGAPGPLAGWLPTDENTAFNASAAGLTETATTALRNPGLGSQDRAEFEAKMRAYQPKTTSTDPANEARFETMLTRLNAKRAGLGLPPLSWADEASLLGGGGFTDEHRQQILEYLPQAKSAEDLVEFAKRISEQTSTIGNPEDVLKYVQGGGDPSKLKFEPGQAPPTDDIEFLGFEDE